MALDFKADSMKFQDGYYHVILFYYLIEDLLRTCRSIVKKSLDGWQKKNK